MKVINTFFVIGVILILSMVSQAQVKYVGGSKNTSMFSVSYSKFAKSKIFSGQFNYSKTGDFGTGILIQYSNNPQSYTLGFECEYALYRPVNETTLGVNLLGAFARSWSSIPYVRISRVGSLFKGAFNSHKELYGNSVALGGEIYLHVPESIFRVEPFFQYSRTFTWLTTSDYNDYLEYSNKNSCALGTDIILGSVLNNFFVFTGGVIFPEQAKNTLEISISFIHSVQ